MYIKYAPELKLSLACLAVVRHDYRDTEVPSVAQAAAAAGVSEKQVHFWKDWLLEKGVAVFAALKPGVRPEKPEEVRREDKELACEVGNRLLGERFAGGGKGCRTAPELKRKILEERERLKKEGTATYAEFAKAVGLAPVTLTRWDQQYEAQGEAGLVDRSTAPLRRPRALHPELVAAVTAAGSGWTWRGKEKKLAAFARAFRESHQELLARHGQEKISSKTIAKYLRRAGLRGPAEPAKPPPAQNAGVTGTISPAHSSWPTQPIL